MPYKSGQQIHAPFLQLHKTKPVNANQKPIVKIHIYLSLKAMQNVDQSPIAISKSEPGENHSPENQSNGIDIINFPKMAVKPK